MFILRFCNFWDFGPVYYLFSVWNGKIRVCRINYYSTPKGKKTYDPPIGYQIRVFIAIFFTPPL